MDEFLYVSSFNHICPHTTLCPHTTTRVCIGLVEDLRGRVWMEVSGASLRLENSPALYSQLLEETGERCDRLGTRFTCFTGTKWYKMQVLT